MEYNAFLHFLHQMEVRSKAKVVVQGSVIFIETSSKNAQWSLSTKILHAPNKKLEQILGFYLHKGSLKWQKKGAHITLDPETRSVELVQEIAAFKKYLPFKYLVEDFASLASEWKEIFQTCSSEDLVS